MSVQASMRAMDRSDLVSADFTTLGNQNKEIEVNVLNVHKT